MPDLFFQDVFAKQDGQQDADGGTNEIEEMRVVELRIDDQVADAMRQFLDDDCGGTRTKTRRDAEYQHETAVGHVCRPPFVELVNPSVDFVFQHGFSRFAAAKIGKSNARRKKK